MNKIRKVYIPLYLNIKRKTYKNIMVVYSEDHTQETRRRGRIEVICGSMFSGKTEDSSAE
ncbi:thymidine kinase [Bacteroides pyogenes JCM 6292]|uniref:Thymidine kinase n=1 Tax=Bacteroides pyogenes JCM 6292 TaxID=1235809 RepID=W4P4C3_9BACE|nr:thymidine kinase [Bacteroides pyogenes JCM 6292]